MTGPFEAGFSIKGSYWNQLTHSFGTAFAVDGLSKDAQAYFAAGGTGILIGDGQLPHYSTEQIMEAYNADRGPVSIWGLRLHAEF